MSQSPKLISGFLVLVLVAAACEHAPLSSLEPKIVDETAVVQDDAAADTVAPEAETVESGCGLDGLPGDAEFASLLCDYQAVLVGALSSGVVVDPALTSQVSDAIAAYLTDPTGARNVVVAVIAAIEQQIANVVPLPLSPTVADLADGAFDCMARAGELLQEAFQRESIGGVIIPQMEQWQLAFDDAAELAAAGDVIGATAIVCDLNIEMEAVLFQS